MVFPLFILFLAAQEIDDILLSETLSLFIAMPARRQLHKASAIL